MEHARNVKFVACNPREEVSYFTDIILENFPDASRRIGSSVCLVRRYSQAVPR